MNTQRSHSRAHTRAIVQMNVLNMTTDSPPYTTRKHTPVCSAEDGMRTHLEHVRMRNSLVCIALIGVCQRRHTCTISRSYFPRKIPRYQIT